MLKKIAIRNYRTLKSFDLDSALDINIVVGRQRCRWVRIRHYCKQIAGDQARLFLLSSHDDGARRVRPRRGAVGAALSGTASPTWRPVY